MADPAPSGVFTGLRFPPGGAPSFLGVAAHELRDRHVSLDDVWSSADVRRLEERMAAAGRPDLMLERLAVGRLGGTRHPEPLLHELVAVLRAGVPVAVASRAVGLGERQLRRRCLDAFGYGPKLLQRILRMERAVALARKDVPLAETAARAGYADQAHLARDVRALAGVTLTGLLS